MSFQEAVAVGKFDNLPTAFLAELKKGVAFATLLGVSARTLQDWEQGRRSPTGAAKPLLKVAVTHPEVLREIGT
jgi:putative transcriptional regulator